MILTFWKRIHTKTNWIKWQKLKKAKREIVKVVKGKRKKGMYGNPQRKLLADDYRNFQPEGVAGYI